MKLLEFYKAILATARLTVSDDGYVSSELMGDKSPFLISGKRLVIPTTDQLRNPDRDSRIVFHPLRENSLQTGESIVLTAFRNAVNTRLNASIALLFASIIRLASSEVEDKQLNPDQSDCLRYLKNVDTKTFDNLSKLLEAMPLKQNKKAFVSLYIKKGGVLQTKRYKKVTIVSFPLYKELLESKDDVYGVKLRQKDRNAYKALLEYIFPNIDQDNHYSYGSESDIAPSLESLLGAIKNIGTQINNQVAIYTKDYLDEPEEIEIASDWVETTENIEVLLPEIRQIPSQFGNDGRAATTPVENVAAPTLVSSTPTVKKDEGLIPVKPKLEFAGLPSSQPNPVSTPTLFQNQPLQPTQVQNHSSGRGLGLASAMSGLMNNMGNMGMQQQPMFNQQNRGFIQPQQNMMGNNLSFGGIGNNQGMGFGGFNPRGSFSNMGF